MKKNYLFIAFALLSSATMSQTFTDNFDTYTAGQYLGPQSAGAWTTWSNQPGTAEDVMVSNADAASAPNSLHFTSTTQAGGPTDLVRNFGVLNTGQFEMSFKMKVGSGKAGYFNLQRNATIGQVWAMDAAFNDDGTLSVYNQNGLSESATYPQGVWFDFMLQINFNTNTWEIFINNTSVMNFANPINQIASIDIYPVDQNTPYNADYFIDDFSTTITPYTLTSLNAAVTLASFNGGAIATNSVTPTFKVRNLGTTAITSFDMTVNYNGNNINQSYTGLNMASLAEQSFTVSTPIVLAAGNLPLTFTVSNVNTQGQDNDAQDDAKTLMVNPVVPANGKMVVGEEGTGTWCGWCPRGTVAMDHMENLYGNYWAGIAVHNGDPMTVTSYDTPIGAFFSGYPSAMVDRGNVVDPSEMEPDFLTRLQVAPKAFITNGATWNATTRELKVSVSANFQSAANNTYRLACVLTEDSIKGTASGYNQSNYYSSSSQNLDLINDAGLNWKNLPNPVPAAQMRYDHVARAINPSFDGLANSFPAVVASGETHTVNFVFTLPATWNENKIHIIGLLIDPQGDIDNAGKATISEAVSNGFVPAATASLEDLTSNQLDDVVKLYPNPAQHFTNIEINVKEATQLGVSLMDMSGKMIAQKDNMTINQPSIITLPLDGLNSGVYLVKLSLNGNQIMKRIIVE